MGLFDMLLNNATEVNIADIQKEFADILIEGEHVESAYCVIRDKWVFTNKRLILLDIQGLTGSKREYRTIPYSSITQFSAETAGSLDDDTMLKIWVKGMPEPLSKEFAKKKTNIKAIQRALAQHLL